MKIKICGITKPEQAAEIDALGAAYVGAIFEPKSPRCVNTATARAISEALSRAQCVGVFVNQDADFIVGAVRAAKLGAVQIHAPRDNAFIDEIRLRTNAEVWRAVWLDSVRSLEDALECSADRLVVDSRSGSAVGGTGVCADWNFAAELAASRSVVLAGGISPENAAAAAERVKPYCLDANSKLETSAGVKNMELVKKLFELKL